MPKIVKLREYNPPNLLEEFSSNDLLPASGNDLGSANEYIYAAFNDLRMWFRFSIARYSYADLVNYDPTKKPGIHYRNYSNSSIFQTQTIYSNQIRVVNLEGSKYIDVEFPGGSGNTNITSFGINETDSAFTIGTWFKFNSDATPASINPIFTKGKVSYREYEASSDASGNITFTLYAANNTSAFGKIITGATSILDGNWHYLTFTYDGRGGSNSALGLSIYVDGESVSGTQSNSASPAYTGMDDVSNRFRIGADHSNSNIVNGNFAEFAIWAKELSIEEIKAIYNWTREDSVIKSGYTNLPPRIRLRDIDNRPGCYPTKHRMGDKDRSGKANIFYEDLPIQFGNEIKDDFTNVPNTDLITADTGFDSKKWAVSSGMTIRREIIQGLEGIISDRCATFSGDGTAGKRFLRSRQKIRNPYRFYFELLQGPYQSSDTLLNLSLGKLDESLKLEIATDTAFTSPTTIATYVPTPDPTGEYSLVGQNRKPRRVISLSTSDFPDLGEEYYFRFVQETFTSTKNVWAIANIEVEYANQNIRYPLLLDHSDRAGNKIANLTLGNSNISGSLTTTGRSVKGVSDLGNPFQDFSETISAFNETLVVEKADDEFFNQGLNPDLYPGFKSPTKSKTKITVDLTPSEATSFGNMQRLSVTQASAASDTSKQGQQLMVYWNNNLKRWEKIGVPVHAGNAGYADLAAFQADFLHQLTQSCLGFSPQPLHIFKGPDIDNLEFENEGYLRQAFKKTDTYCFPYGPQYFASSSFVVKAKDIGITKPFLLEKTLIEFNANMHFGGDRTVAERYRHQFLDTDDANPSKTTRFSNGLASFVPTFFMLRQFNDTFTQDSNEEVVRSSTDVSVNKSFEIPGNYAITSGSNTLTYIDKNREMITYSNIQFIMSQSDANSSVCPKRSDGSYFQLDDFVKAGLAADANHIKFYTYAELSAIDFSYPPFSGKFSISSPVKVKSILPKGVTSIRVNRGDGQAFLRFANKNTINDSILKNGRLVVNGYSSYTNDSPIDVPGESDANPLRSIALPTPDSVEQLSAYLILPEDELILGWQYPISNNPLNGAPGTDSTDNQLSFMTLQDDAKLHLYGSEVVENKEYHETVNQNLTSCAVYEHIIGDEKIVDQWQVAYRGELTGSVNSYGVFNYGSYFSNNEDAYSYAYNAEYVFDSVADVLKPSYRVNDYKKLIPSKRIGLKVFSTTNGKNVLRDMFTSIGSDPDNADAFYELLPATQKHIRLRDQDRVYSDGEKLDGHFYDDSSYGTYNLTDNNNTAALTNHRPRYRFNIKHFGYVSDMLQQGLDSKFERIIPTPANEKQFNTLVSTQAPVRTIFVEGKTTEGSEQKIYSRKRLEFLLDDENFQSSNLSTFSTSSIPFIDDNTPRNRTYITNPVITLTP